jgi:subtilase family serine protease
MSLAPLDGYGYAVYTPAQVRAAYGFSSLPYDGTGQTIAIVAVSDDPYIASDLSMFDRAFGLPGQTPASVSQFFTKVNEYGQAANYPPANALWDAEIALDVEWTHAIAPGAHILLVEAAPTSGYDLLNALNTARTTPGVSVVSMSWGTTEFSTETYFDSLFTTPAGHLGGNGQPGGITFVAAAGDSGAWNGPDWPSVSPNVLAVGGTNLSIYGYTYAGETAWSGGGGGVSQYTARPSWQAGVQSSNFRTTPDVSYNANPYTGFYLYSTITPWAGYQGWLAVGGTSAGAPQWSGLIALADQARAQVGRPSLDGAQAVLYSLPRSDFHDITSGFNGYSATVGYDLATGLGSPYANRIVPDLLLVAGDPGYSSSRLAGPSGQPHSTNYLLEDQGASPNDPLGTAADLGQTFSWIATYLRSANSITTDAVPVSSAPTDQLVGEPEERSSSDQDNTPNDQPPIPNGQRLGNWSLVIGRWSLEIASPPSA